MAGNKVCIGLLLTLLAALTSQAQDRYAVYFKYKPQSDFSLSEPHELLSQKAIDRRVREGIQADSLDMPVAERYLTEIAPFSHDLLYTSKWMNAAIVVADQDGVDQMSDFPFVERVELVAHGFLDNPQAKIRNEQRPAKTREGQGKRAKLNTLEFTPADNSYDFQNQLLGVDEMHGEGYTGKGVTIAVFDAGFPGIDTASAFKSLFANNQIVGQRDFVRPWNTDVFIANQHGTNVLSLIAANDSSKLVSGAYDSDFILVITEEVETEFRVEEFNWVRAAEYVDSLGVDIISSSLGYWDFDDSAMNYKKSDLDGKTAVISRGAAIASAKGILVVNSIGNYGSMGKSSLLAPADAEGIISVGSVTRSGEISSFSSTGPTADGRLKPELVAFGDSPVLIRANGAVGSSNGTSFAAPQISALAAGLWQAKPHWTKEELMKNLFRSATQFEDPDNLVGYGVPNFYTALYGEVLAVEDEKSIQWKVYPNPLYADELNIRFGLGLNAIFELVDLTGRTILKKEVSRTSASDPYRVTLTGIQSGLYLIIMQEGATVKSTKLIRR
jgi:subtilisin family serine protease